MIGRHVRKKTTHYWPQPARDSLHEAGAFRETHYAEPERHDPDQAKRDRNCGFRAVERAVRDIFEPIVPAADRDCEENEREPNVVEHDVL